MTTTATNAQAKDTTTTTSSSERIDLSQYDVTFLHLDLGIGGAEALVLQLAHATRDLLDDNDNSSSSNDSAEKDDHLQIWTTRCDPTHCFASVRPDTGILHHALRVYGKWIPADVLGGRFRALCSTARLWYLTLQWIVKKGRQPNQIVVLDVLPTPLPLLQWLTTAHVIFYCHFPDQLLTRSNNKTDETAFRRYYRQLLNWMEDSTMPFADVIAVNSKFTRTVVQETFASLRNRELPVLYPALDTSSLDDNADKDDGTAQKKNSNAALRPIVSLNRYERKKNLELLLQALQWIRQEYSHVKLPPVIIAGGYDIQNVENVQYRAELGQLVQDYSLHDVVTFQQSITDAERQTLLQTALCVVYTPSNEHFGIVPIEAMYCKTAVLAVNSGGPTESIADGKTGYLRPPTAVDFGKALLTWIQKPQLAETMGRAGRQHVQDHFGFAPRMVQEWQTLLTETVLRARQRQGEALFYRYRVGHGLVYVVEAVVVLCICLVLTWFLRQMQVLEPQESIVSGIRRVLRRDEL